VLFVYYRHIYLLYFHVSIVAIMSNVLAINIFLLHVMVERLKK